MYNMNDEIDKQSILNDLESINFFNNNEISKNFVQNLYNQLMNNFPYLMQNVNIDEMEFLIEQFDLQNGVNKNNIRELIVFLKKYNNDVNQSKEQYLENNIQENMSEITDAINIFNNMVENNDETSHPQYLMQQENEFLKVISTDPGPNWYDFGMGAGTMVFLIGIKILNDKETFQIV